jgi:tRNA(fMet)-specific endonuclease VapC
MPDRDLAITVVSAEEQVRGWLSVIHRASGDRLVTAYALFHKTLDYYRTIRLLDFSPAALDRYAELRQAKTRIGTKDLRIAAIALAASGTLVTRNMADFSQIPALPLEDWTSAQS